MLCFMEILKIYLEEQPLIKYCVIKYLKYIAKNRKYDEHQRGHASMIYKLFGKMTSAGAVKSETMPNKQLAEQLHKRVIRKLEKRKEHSSLISNIWGADLAGM